MGTQFSLTILFVLISKYFVFGAPTSAMDSHTVENISYIDDMKLSYDNDIWQCDELTCPPQTYGCRMQRKNVIDKNNTLIRMNACIDSNEKELNSISRTETIPEHRLIDIDIVSHVEAQSLYTNGYSFSGQIVAGIIAVEHWESAKNDAREMMKIIEESKAKILN